MMQRKYRANETDRDLKRKLLDQTKQDELIAVQISFLEQADADRIAAIECIIRE